MSCEICMIAGLIRRGGRGALRPAAGRFWETWPAGIRIRHALAPTRLAVRGPTYPLDPVALPTLAASPALPAPRDRRSLPTPIFSLEEQLLQVACPLARR